MKITKKMREAARQLALLGGSEPNLKATPRRRSKPARKVKTDSAKRSSS